MLQDEKIVIIVLDMNYTDAHCHVISDTPCPDMLVGRICNATNQSEWDKIINSADDRNFGCIGIHPWNIESVSADWESEMCDVLAQSPTLMVGEIGMDKYHPNIDIQEEIFVRQIQIASEFNRPAHIHCVGAWDKILHIFKELHKSMPPLVVVHAFAGAPDIITRIAEQYNIYFSYSMPEDTKAITRISNTPIARLLIESDAHDNDTEVQTIENTMDAISGILGMEHEAIVEQIYQNFQRVISYVRPIE